ncbi:hypothetical protein NQ314_014628 [Rhamnusium bicolor]|uniref:Dehydrogenase/reductase SDR family member 11 n=1 Tax=Rhamnusium bicolor TaxID=1586634 RepID=A0AAV8X0H6_9CUCU|nr:hypothetical protein NQ314_014628 [Rhamnusium bicolor]
MVLSLDRWIGKVAIVTGASSGIGAAIAEQLEKRNSIDITKEEDISNGFKWVKENLGPVHILVNNAGTGGRTNLTDGDTEIWKNIFQLNVIGLCIATREAIKDMKANKVDGHIIHINSTLGHQTINYPGLNVYPASKFAVTALAETLRLELNFKSLSPGLVNTEFFTDELKQSERFKRIIEGKQILDPVDIADGVIYVLSTPPHVQTLRDTHLKPVAELPNLRLLGNEKPPPAPMWGRALRKRPRPLLIKGSRRNLADMSTKGKGSPARVAAWSPLMVLDS